VLTCAQDCAKRARKNWTPTKRAKKADYLKDYKKVRNCFTALFVVRYLLLLTLLQAAEPDDDFRVNELQGKRDHRAKCVLCGVSLP
jgi:hypothetical protein